MLARNLLAAGAAFSVAAAQTSTSACSQATTTISAQADVSALASCSTYTGNIVIAPAVSGTLDLSGPEQIVGDLVVVDAINLISLTSSSVGSISGTFNLTGLTTLTTLQFSDLTSVGNIAWSALPVLQTLTFPSTISSAKNVLITNTFLNTLDGINLQTVASLDINNNQRLQTFSTQLANATSLINIEANGNNLDVEFPNLISAANLTFRNVSGVSIPSLKSVNGSLGFYGNYITELSCPNLTIVGLTTATNTGSLAIVGNAMLQNVSFPLLQTVEGADQIANNTALMNISMPALKTVGGAIDFSGNFSSVDLGSLSLVSGGFNLQSSGNVDCSPFDSDHTKNIILGTYTCQGNSTDVKSGVGSSTSTGSSSSATSKGAAASYNVNEAVAGLSVVGGLLSMLL